MNEMKKQNITIKLKNMSKNSGVYKMLDRTGNVIYIGKAKNLKNRVSQYFTESNNNIRMQACKRTLLPTRGGNSGPNYGNTDTLSESKSDGKWSKSMVQVAVVSGRQ